MEALGAATTIIGVIETAAALFQTCLQYSLAVKDAKKDIKRLQQEAFDVQSLLARIADLANEPRANELPALREVLAPNGPLETCSEVMVELLDQLGANKKGPEMRRFGLRALKWPFKSEDVDGTLVVLERCKSSFSLAIAADHMKLALNTNQETRDYQKGQYKEKIVSWLASVESGVSWSNHEDARKKHEPETGLWLLDQADGYQNWKKEAGQLLWIWGMPGCGKTVMTSSIIEDLQLLVEKEKSAMLAYFYFDFGTPAKQNVLNCVRYVLSRIVNQGKDDISPELKNLYVKKCNYGHEEPNVEDLTEMLEQLILAEEVSDLYLVLDGLDEAPTKGEKRPELLAWLTGLLSNLSAKLHLCVSSRPETDIRDRFSELDQLIEISMEEDKVGGDITLFVQKALATHSKLKKLPVALKDNVQEALLTRAQGMFQWADCQLDELKRCKTKVQVEQALKTLPSSLPATYERILEAIDDKAIEYARRALWWLVTARRPLTVEELAEAAIIDLGQEPAFHEDYRFFDPREELSEILGSLISITSTAPGTMDSTDPFTPASAILPVETVRLSHFSVQEYLLSEGLRNSKNEKLKGFSTRVSDMNEYLSESSLQYLYCYINSESRLVDVEDTAEFPLLLYAAQRWPTHLSASTDEEDNERISGLAVKLLQEQALREAWLQVYTPHQPRKKLFAEPDETGGEAIHYASLLGLNNMLKLIAPEGCDNVNCTTESGITPLIWAATYKQIDTIKTLIMRGANVNAQTRAGRTALCCAAQKGSLLAVHYLVRAGAEVDLPDVDGWTPCYFACESNHLDVAKYLLRDRSDLKVAKLLDETLPAPFNKPLAELAKADPGFRTTTGGSALHQVAGWGYVDVLALLLKHGAEVNISSEHGRTPLHQAAAGGQPAVVKLLLEAGANPHTMDRFRRNTARELAEDGGHLELADYLMEAEEKTPRGESKLEETENYDPYEESNFEDDLARAIAASQIS